MSDETDGREAIDAIQWSRQWMLDPGTTYLNHGSFGAAPKKVLERQRELREQLERNPVGFFGREYGDMLDRARAELAEFVGADADGMAFVSNATTGINAILRSRSFDPGDELLVPDQGYPACRHALEFVAGRSGADIRVAELPCPVDSPDQIVDAVLEATTPRTELALIDHVSSPTGMVFPVEAIVDALEERHVDTLVDGAHAPGMVDLDVSELDPTYYVGNCHKWMCAPKGAAFLWVDEHERDTTHPLTISNGYGMGEEPDERFRREFDWTGTRDPTPWLCVPTAIEFLSSLAPAGWAGIRRRNRELALAAREMMAERLGRQPPMPASMVGALATVGLPERPETEVPGPVGKAPLETTLSREHGIEVPVESWLGAPRSYIRMSAQLYNDMDDYERLARVLEDELN